MKNISVLKYVSENSKYVLINHKKINQFIDKIKDLEYHHWLKKEKVTLNEKESIIFAFICETMNFCFWSNRKWEVHYNGINYRGSEALFHSLLKAIDYNDKFLDINYLLNLKKKEFKKIVQSNGQLPPMFNKRYKLLKETIKVIHRKGEQFFEELFAVKTDEQLLNYIVKNFKHFYDKSKFKGKTIHFNKKAILLTNDLFCLSKTIRKNIRTVKNLTGGADYALPKIFEENGIFQYSNELLNIVINQKTIRHNSRMEVEIRANTLYVLGLIQEQLKKRNVNINSVELDNIIWKTRNTGKSKKPYHHTKTIYY